MELVDPQPLTLVHAVKVLDLLRVRFLPVARQVLGNLRLKRRRPRLVLKSLLGWVLLRVDRLQLLSAEGAHISEPGLGRIRRREALALVENLRVDRLRTSVEGRG